MNVLKLKLARLLIIPTLYQKHTLWKEEHSSVEHLIVAFIVAFLYLQFSKCAIIQIANYEQINSLPNFN